MRFFKKLDDASFIFTVLRVATVIVGALGTLLALLLGYVGLLGLTLTSRWSFDPIKIGAMIGLLVVACASVCCYRALFIFFQLCGRLSRGTAFTDANAIAMRRIAFALLVPALAIAGGTASICVLLEGINLWLLISFGIALGFLGGALLSHALAVLVRRAVALQQESELTI